MTTSIAPPIETIALVSLGCPKNLVDSEKMLGLLAEDGLIPIGDESQADAIVINTCGFLEASKEESIEEIRHALQYKQDGNCQRVIVAGCLVQRHRAKILEWCPGVDAIIGVFDRDHIVDAVRGGGPLQQDVAIELPVYTSISANATLARQHAKQYGSERAESETSGGSGGGYFESDAARLRLTPRHYAYLRMSEGCNQNCAFCTIPSIRGKMRSKPVPAILSEAQELFADGVFELNLIGQDTTSYGQDINYAAGLAGLLGELDRLSRQQGGAWLRLMYAYPSCFTDEMIDAMAALPNVLKYIDMPLQHINDQVLDRMRRRTSRQLIQTLLQKLRDRVPGIAIRTTFISGFPGETETQHRELVEFVEDFGFDAMGVFGYSPEPGTPAGTLHQAHAVEQAVIDARTEDLMLAQQKVVFDRNEAWVALQQVFDVLIDEVDPENGQYIGRTFGQAPQVDSVTYVQSREALVPGELVRCRVIETADYDLIAQPLAELEKRISLPLA